MDLIHNPASLAIIGVFGIPIAAIVGSFWASAVKARSVNELKRSMVERGMSADEIVRVIEAEPKGR